MPNKLGRPTEVDITASLHRVPDTHTRSKTPKYFATHRNINSHRPSSFRARPKNRPITVAASTRYFAAIQQLEER